MSTYAGTLRDRLTARGLSCFLDDYDAPPGTPLTETIEAALRRSTVLVLLATHEALSSEWVEKEVVTFAQLRRRRRTIVAVDFEGALRAANLRKTKFAVLYERDYIWEDEEPDAKLNGAPSTKVVDRIERLFGWRRQRSYVTLLATVVIVALLVAAILTTGSAMRANTEARRATDSARVAQDQREKASREAARADSNARLAEQERDSAIEQQRIAESRALAAESSRPNAQEIDRALSMSASAYRISPTVQATAALLATLSKSPRLVRYFHCAEERFATAVAFDTAGRWLAYACENTVGVVALATMQLASVRQVGGEAVRGLTFEGASALSLRGEHGSRLLDLETGHLTATRGEPSRATSDSSRLQRTPNGWACEGKYPTDSRYYPPVTRSRDGRRIATVSSDNRIFVSRDTVCLEPLPGNTHNVADLAFGGRAGQWLASAGQIGRGRFGVVVWNLEQVHPLATQLSGSSNELYYWGRVAISADGKSWACAGCGSIRWNGNTVPMPPQSQEPSDVVAMALSPTGVRLAIGGRTGRVLVITNRSGHMEVSQGSIHHAPIRYVSFVNDAQLVSLDDSGYVGEWKAGLISPTKRVAGFRAEPLSIGGPRSGPRAAVSGVYGPDVHAALWIVDLLAASAKRIDLPKPQEPCLSVAYSSAHDTVFCAASISHPLLLLDATTARISKFENPLFEEENGLSTNLSDAQLSADGSVLVAISDQKEVLILDTRALIPVGILPLKDVQSIALSADGHRLITSSRDGVLLWALDGVSWMHKAALIANVGA